MAAKLLDPVDPATSVHLHLGNLDRARALAQQRGVSVARVLRDLLRDALDRIDTVPSVELDATPTLERQLASQILEDITAPSVALGHVDPDDDDLDGFVAQLVSGGHTL